MNGTGKSIGSLMTAGLLLMSGIMPLQAASWQIDPKKSQISFSGQHVGKAFQGQFGAWTGTIEFDPAEVLKAKAVILVDVSSARTGDKTYDKTLPTSDWFNTAKFAQAKFETKAFRQMGPNAYVADATLTMRGVSVPISLPFTLSFKGNQVLMQGQVTLKRTDWGIGKGPDAMGDWVSLDIPVKVSVTATRKP